MYEGREFSSTTQESSVLKPAPGQAQSLRLPRFSTAWARWCTKTFGADLQFSLHAGGRVWAWRPVWHSTMHNPAPTHWACTLHGSVNSQPFICWLDSLLPLVAPPLVQENLTSLPEALLAAVMQDVAAESLARLGAALGQQVTLHSMRCAPPLAPEQTLDLEEGLPFTLTLVDTDANNAPSKINGLLAAAWPHPFFAALYQAAEQELARKELTLSHWPIPCAIIWRTRPLPLADLRELVPGDVLLMPHMTDGDAKTLPVHVQVGFAEETGWGQSSFAARWCAAQHTVTLETAMGLDMTEYEESASTEILGVADKQETMTTHEEAAPSAAPATSPTLEQCRVPIQCRLGEVSISLAELATLAPGAVLQALDSVDDPVTLWLGATRIGRGALVDVDGRVGVRITEIIPPTRRG